PRTFSEFRLTRDLRKSPNRRATSKEEANPMASHTIHVVQAFEERDGGIVPVERRPARPRAPPHRWPHGSRLLPSASLPGYARAIAILATGVRRKFWSEAASSPMNMKPVAE